MKPLLETVESDTSRTVISWPLELITGGSWEPHSLYSLLELL